MEGGEECSSSESGWTMYLASPMHDDDDDQDDQVDENVHEDDHGQEEEEEDDDNEDDGDSMASDASTGPTHSKQSNERGEGGGVVDDGKPCTDEKSSKFSSYSCMKSTGGKKVEKKIMYDGKRSTKDVSQNETSAASLYDHKVSKTK